MPQVHGTRRGLTIVAVAALLLGSFASAHAALTTPACLAKKLKEWGNLRKCQATENGKALQAKSADPAKCQTKFDANLAKLTAKAAEAAIACRYGANGDGTVTDYDTGLQWEKKTGCSENFCFCVAGDPHCVGTTYTWGDAVSYVNGTTVDGSVLSGAFAGFAGHSDWRLPTIVELLGILDPSVAGCSTNGGPACIDPIFGPTGSPFFYTYWSATADYYSPDDNAWVGTFRPNFPSFEDHKTSSYYVRGVRSAL